LIGTAGTIGTLAYRLLVFFAAATDMECAG
jgi:hypothetical protein